VSKPDRSAGSYDPGQLVWTPRTVGGGGPEGSHLSISPFIRSGVLPTPHRPIHP